MQETATIRLMTKILAPKLSGLVEYVCIHRILDETSGAKPKREWSRLMRFADFAESADSSVRAVENAIAHALKVKLIERKKVGHLGMFKLCPENWEAAPDYRPKLFPSAAPLKPVTRAKTAVSVAPALRSVSTHRLEDHLL